jgi:photosystem II stability/assembly factor-like uncharacterized protein
MVRLSEQKVWVWHLAAGLAVLSAGVYGVARAATTGRSVPRSYRLHREVARVGGSVVASGSTRGLTIEPYGVGFWTRQRGLLLVRPLSRECARNGTCRGAMVERTTDGGRQWQIVDRLAPPAEAISVASRGAAWVTIGQCAGGSLNRCGSRRLLVSSNGGKVWRRVISSRAVTSVSALSASKAWAIAVQSRPPYHMSLVRTTDGGRKWRDEVNPCQGRTTSGLAAVSFPSSSRGWVSCASGPATGTQAKAVVATADGGATWQLRSECAPQTRTYVGSTSCGGYVSALQMLVDGHGWLWMDRNGLASTGDGGRTWHTLAKNVVFDDSNDVLSASLVRDSDGFMLISQPEHRCPSSRCGPELLATHDGGVKWTRLRTWPRWP